MNSGRLGCSYGEYIWYRNTKLRIRKSDVFWNYSFQQQKIRWVTSCCLPQIWRLLSGSLSFYKFLIKWTERDSRKGGSRKFHEIYSLCIRHSSSSKNIVFAISGRHIYFLPPILYSAQIKSTVHLLKKRQVYKERRSAQLWWDILDHTNSILPSLVSCDPDKRAAKNAL